MLNILLRNTKLSMSVFAGSTRTSLGMRTAVRPVSLARNPGQDCSNPATATYSNADPQVAISNAAPKTCRMVLGRSLTTPVHGHIGTPTRFTGILRARHHGSSSRSRDAPSLQFESLSTYSNHILHCIISNARCRLRNRYQQKALYCTLSLRMRGQQHYPQTKRCHGHG